MVAKSGRRDDVLIATRLQRIRNLRGGGPITPEIISIAVESLPTSLQTDYIDPVSTPLPNRGFLRSVRTGIMILRQNKQETPITLPALDAMDSLQKQERSGISDCRMRAHRGTAQWLRISEHRICRGDVVAERIQSVVPAI